MTVIFTFISLSYRVDYRPADGPMFEGFPVSFIVTSAWTGASSIDYLALIIDLIFWYFISDFIFWIYDKVKKKKR